MLGEVAKLFDRNFAIAYFLPAVGFVAATHFVATHRGILQPVFIPEKETLFQNVTLFLLMTLLVAVMLSVLNRGVVRLMEGYWPFRLGQYLNLVERWRYRRLLEHELRIDEERDKYSADDLPQNIRQKRNRIKRRKAQRFPDKPHLILPTSFGNTFRAFETYPRAVYGIDAIPGWYRLLGVVPAEYRGLIDAARARIDLWVNFSFLAALAILEYATFALVAKGVEMSSRQNLWWFPVLMLVLAYLGYRLATNAVAEWGHWVKSAFDLYLPELRKKLEFAVPNTTEEQKAMWAGFSQAAVYRSASAMPKKITKSSDESNDSKEWRDLVKLSELHLVKNALEILRADIQTPNKSGERKSSPMVEGEPP